MTDELAAGPSGAHMTSVNVKVDCGDADCVVFPGHVQNTEKALNMLGGESAIAKALSGPNPALACRPRPTV
jgi:Tau95 Triple barrel domain